MLGDLLNISASSVLYLMLFVFVVVTVVRTVQRRIRRKRKQRAKQVANAPNGVVDLRRERRRRNGTLESGELTYASGNR